MTNSPTASATSGSQRVLVIGDGDAPLEAVDLIAKLGLEPVIMEVPTVERLEALRDAAYAVVAPGQATDMGSLLLAVGFMLAVLGKARICVLASPDAAAPPALKGAFSVEPDDDGLWHLLLAREMRRAGLAVDLNRVV